MSEVSLFVLAGIDRGLRLEDRTIDPYLTGTGIRPEDLQRYRPGRCRWAEFARVMEALSDDLGGHAELRQLCQAMSQSPPGLLAFLGKRYVRPQTLYYAGAKWYAPAMFHGITATITYVEDGQIQVLSLAPHLEPSETVFEFFAGVMEGTPTIMGWPRARVELVCEGHSASYRIHIVPPDGEVYDASADERERVVADSDLLELAVFGRGEDETRALEVPGPPPPPETGPVAQRTRWLLEGNGAGPALTASEAARALGMSERSLARALSDEGTGFRELRDEVRQERAITMLRAGERIDRIARHLGFSDPSAFHRAFRRWTGRSPGSFAPRD